MINDMLFITVLLWFIMMFYVNFSSAGRRKSQSSKLMRIFQKKTIMKCENSYIIFAHKLYLLYVIFVVSFVLIDRCIEISYANKEKITILMLSGAMIIRLSLSAVLLYYDSRYTQSKKVLSLLADITLFTILYIVFYDLLLK